jgi:hypothetical protein
MSTLSTAGLSAKTRRSALVPKEGLAGPASARSLCLGGDSEMSGDGERDLGDWVVWAEIDWRVPGLLLLFKSGVVHVIKSAAETTDILLCQFQSEEFCFQKINNKSSRRRSRIQQQMLRHNCNSSSNGNNLKMTKVENKTNNSSSNNNNNKKTKTNPLIVKLR